MSNLAQLDIADRDMAAQSSRQSSRQILKTADHLMKRGQHRMALAGLLPLLQESSLDVEVLDRAASCYFQLGDFQTAISLVEVLIQLRPDLTAGWGKLAAMKHTLGDKQGAIEGYCKVLKDNNVQADLYIYEKYKIDSITLRQNIEYYATKSFRKSKEIEEKIGAKFIAKKAALEKKETDSIKAKKEKDSLRLPKEKRKGEIFRSEIYKSPQVNK